MSWTFELLYLDEDGETTEGPIWTGRELLFTNIRRDRILRYDPKSGDIDEWRTGTNRTNGLAMDACGRIFGCCAGGRSIVRFDSTEPFPSSLCGVNLQGVDGLGELSGAPGAAAELTQDSPGLELGVRALTG